MKQITILCLALILITGILAQSGVLTGLILFLLMGIIPGTDYSIPAWIMLTAMLAIIWLMLMRTFTAGIIQMLRIRHILRRHFKVTKHLPRRRYNQVNT